MTDLKPRAYKNTIRNSMIYNRVLDGETYKSVGDDLGLSAGRVRQIFFRSARAEGLTGSQKDIRAAKIERGEA